jgi:hypothetical protein
MTVGQLRGRLRTLELPALVQLRDYEQAHAHRIQITTMLENRISKLSEAPAPTAPTPTDERPAATPAPATGSSAPATPGAPPAPITPATVTVTPAPSASGGPTGGGRPGA